MFPCLPVERSKQVFYEVSHNIPSYLLPLSRLFWNMLEAWNSFQSVFNTHNVPTIFKLGLYVK